MRPGQVRKPLPPAGVPRFSKRQLLEASGLSGKTFDTIRKAARIKGPGHGGLDWMFTIEDVQALVHRAGSGSFSERGGPAASAWTELLREAGVTIIED